MRDHNAPMKYDFDDNNMEAHGKPLVIGDLYQEKNFDSWKDFVFALMERQHKEQVLWRGQSNSTWQIEPSYMRGCQKDKSSRCEYASELKAYYYDLLRNMPEDITKLTVNPLQRFVNYRGMSISSVSLLHDTFSKYNLSKEDENHDCLECFGSAFDVTYGFSMDIKQWGWGQHYGVKTPLVDWTTHALYSLFFALDTHTAEQEISIYSLNIETLKDINKASITSKYQKFPDFLVNPSKETISIIRASLNKMFHDLPTYSFDINLEPNSKEFLDFYNLFRDMAKLKLILPITKIMQNSRLHSQGGLFTFTPGGISIEDWCNKTIKMFEGQKFNSIIKTEPMLVKHNIRVGNEQSKKQCFAFLENANITAKNLYPDFQGLSKYMEQLAIQRKFDSI